MTKRNPGLATGARNEKLITWENDQHQDISSPLSHTSTLPLGGAA